MGDLMVGTLLTQHPREMWSQVASRVALEGIHKVADGIAIS
jgi:hypothetical protein